MTRYWWYSLEHGWTEQHGPPPRQYLAEAVRRTKEDPDLLFQLAVVRRLTDRDRMAYMACGIDRCGSIVKYMIVDEVGNEIVHYETSQYETAAFVVLIHQVAMDNWKVEG